MRISDKDCKFFKSSDILNSFLSDVRKYPVPTVKEEEELISRYKEGDRAAGESLILGNLRFIYSLAKIYARNESEVLGYVNEGVIGLMKALDEFDSTRGYKFITYGVWYIRRQMNYYLLTKRDTIARSSQVGNIAKKSDAFRQRYFAQYGSMPTNEEIKEALKDKFDICVSNDDDLFETGVSSIDDEVSDDSTVEETSEFNGATASVNDYEETVESEYLKEVLKACLSVLPERAADIIKMKYGVGYDRQYTDSEIAVKYGMDVERIPKVCDYAIKKMRKVSVKRAI